MSLDQANTWDQVLTEMVHASIFPRHVNRMLVWGTSHTGKTRLAHDLLKTEWVTTHQAQPIDDLIGGWTLRDGSTVWADGPAVRALRNGTILQADEFDQFSMECKTAWYSLLGSPAGITLPTGERVEAAPGYGVVATMNPNPSILPEPIFNRFDVILRADTLSAGMKEALGPFAEHAVRCLSRNPVLEWSRPMTPSLLLAAAKLRRTNSVSDEAIAKTLGLVGSDATDFLAAIAE